MARQREQKSVRIMKPVFLVFCEGETEENYIDLIRRKYKSPIKIVSKTEGDKISQHLINQRQQELKISKNEKISTFLMYDLDVKEINMKLESCNATWLCSNPCVELWFLLHSKEQTKSLTTAKCITALKKADDVWKEYHKSTLTDTQKTYLWTNKSIAVERSKLLNDGSNPSSSVYKLIEAIENKLKK